MSLSERYARYWGWFVTLDAISNNVRKDWDYFTTMNVIEFLTTLSFYKDKQEYEKQQLKKIQDASK